MQLIDLKHQHQTNYVVPKKFETETEKSALENKFNPLGTITDELSGPATEHGSSWVQYCIPTENILQTEFFQNALKEQAFSVVHYPISFHLQIAFKSLLYYVRANAMGQ